MQCFHWKMASSIGRIMNLLPNFRSQHRSIVSIHLGFIVMNTHTQNKKRNRIFHGTLAAFSSNENRSTVIIILNNQRNANDYTFQSNGAYGLNECLHSWPESSSNRMCHSFAHSFTLSHRSIQHFPRKFNFIVVHRILLFSSIARILLNIRCFKSSTGINSVFNGTKKGSERKRKGEREPSVRPSVRPSVGVW